MAAMARRRVASVLQLLASAVRALTGIIAALILVHAAFVLFEANPVNDLVRLTAQVRDTCGWFTRDLFATTRPTIGEAIDDALAAVSYLVAGNLVSRLLLGLTPGTRSRA